MDAKVATSAPSAICARQAGLLAPSEGEETWGRGEDSPQEGAEAAPEVEQEAVGNAEI